MNLESDILYIGLNLDKHKYLRRFFFLMSLFEQHRANVVVPMIMQIKKKIRQLNIELMLNQHQYLITIGFQI